MVSLTALWLPILLSAVVVFIASSISHMVLPHHRGDYKGLPDEDKIRAAMREAGVEPGNYYFPFPDDPKNMNSPEMMEKYKEGPMGFANVVPTGPPAMGKNLVFWFVYCVVVGVFAAYLASRTLEAGAHYLGVFRIAGTVAFLAYSIGEPINSIWKAQWWRATATHMIDGLVYALLTAGVFGWLWPDA